MRKNITGGATIIHLGRQGENLATEIAFVDAAGWPVLYGEGRFELVHKRPGDAAFYPVALTLAGQTPVWAVARADLEKSSANREFGEAILRYTAGEVVKKSQTYRTIITASGDDSQVEPPDPAKGWVDQVLAAAADAETAVTKMPQVGENGNWFLWDASSGVFADTGVTASVPGPRGPEGPRGANGSDGAQGPMGPSGLVPRVDIPYAAAIELSANTMTSIAELAGAVSVTLGEGLDGFDNEWDAVLRQGATAQQITLPTIVWGLGIAPAFAAGTTTLCRLYYVGDVLCGEWVRV